MRRINVNLYPKDGFIFTEADGTRIRAANWRAVIKRVVEYRAQNRLPAGDPEMEIMAQACSRQPNICFEDRGSAPVPKPAKTLKARVLQWLNHFLQLQQKDPLSYVDAKTAAGRAAICAKCPKNTPLGVNTCSTCKQALAEFRKSLLGGGRARDSRLGGCEVLGTDLTTAVHLDEIRVNNGALPAQCWRKTSI